MDPDKQKEAEAMLDELHGIIDEEGQLNEWQQMAFDLLLWLTGDGEKPDIQ